MTTVWLDSTNAGECNDRAEKLFPVAIASVTDDGLQLQHCSAVARDTREVVLAAVRENGLALEWASPALQDDMDVVIAAVHCDETGDAIDFASGRLQTNERVCQTAIASLLRGDPTLETELVQT